MSSKIARDIYYDNVRTGDVLKVPRYPNLTGLGGDLGESGMEGDVVLDRSGTGPLPSAIPGPTFYGHNGSSWVPLGGPGAVEPLDITLDAGNETGGNNIVMSIGDNIVGDRGFFDASNVADPEIIIQSTSTNGINIVSENLAVGSTGSVVVATGDQTALGGTDNSGQIVIQTGSLPDGAGLTGNIVINTGRIFKTAGPTGSLDLATGSISNAAGSKTGTIDIHTGSTGSNAGESGKISIYTAETTAGFQSGSISLETGETNNTESGDISLLTGDSITLDSGNASFLTGDAPAGSSGSVTFITGKADISGSVRIGSGQSTTSSGLTRLVTGTGGINSGNLEIFTGGAVDGSGDLSLLTGVSTNGTSGDIEINTGSADTTSGDIEIATGDSDTSLSGDVFIRSGATGGGGNTPGTVNLVTGDSAAAVKAGAISIQTGSTTTNTVASIVLDTIPDVNEIVMSTGGSSSVTVEGNQSVTVHRGNIEMDNSTGGAGYVDFNTVSNGVRYTTADYNAATGSPTASVRTIGVTKGDSGPRPFATATINSLCGKIVANGVNIGYLETTNITVTATGLVTPNSVILLTLETIGSTSTVCGAAANVHGIVNDQFQIAIISLDVDSVSVGAVGTTAENSLFVEDAIIHYLIINPVA